MLRISLWLAFVFFAVNFAARAQSFELPIGGNAYISHSKGARITEKGIENWSDARETIELYFRVSKRGTISLSIPETLNVSGRSVLAFSINGQKKQVTLNEDAKTLLLIGTWQIADTGYVKLTINGISKTKRHFPPLSTLILGGTAVDERTSYVKNNKDNFFYWGRRGPSVHLSYIMPENVDAEWFYNEITVPAGNDVIGSYFMANGFAEGYFGIQVNSANERRVLFSVWSPFETDDPKKIPESHKITMLKKGKDVYTGEFGNEGAGGQSYLKYSWKAGNTFRFLLHATPSLNNYTTYTAYFFAPEQEKWQLIASFNRPQTQTYLKRVHSFLENFIPEYGDQTREVRFNKQWIADAKGNWIELQKARFTIDNTGLVNYRKDYAGGVINGHFFLKNCGFFNGFTPMKTLFDKNRRTEKPTVNFSELPQF